MQLCVAVFGNKSLVTFSCFLYFGTSAAMHVSVCFTLPVSTICAHAQTLTHFLHFFFYLSFLSLSLSLSLSVCLFWVGAGEEEYEFYSLVQLPAMPRIEDFHSVMQSLNVLF